MEKKESLVKDVLKTMLKTMVILVLIFVFGALGFYVINPKYSAQICAELGWKHAEVDCYELLYVRTKDNADLYNLIVKLGNVDEVEDQNSYIDRLLNTENYSEFCNNMDNSVVENFDNGSISAEQFCLLYGVNEYLISTKVINLLKLEKYEAAYELVKSTFGNDGQYEFVLNDYVEYLQADESLAGIKANYFIRLLSDLGTYMQSKISGLPEQPAASKVLTYYTKLRVSYTSYLIVLQTSSDETEIQDSYNTWQQARTDYNNLTA